jgi:hypothetical protein
MDKPYYILCPLGGVIRSAKRELRYLDAGFYGVGFPHWGIESIVESTNKMMTHVGAKTMLGTQYQMSLELLILELGLTANPFSLDFEKYNSWATDCGWKEIWSNMCRFGFDLSVNTVDLSPPRERDSWFMRAIEDAGFSPEECRIINIIWQHQQVVFVSDVFGADGKNIDERYFQRRRRGDNWSKFTFATQKFPPQHFSLWKEALLQLAPNGRRCHRLGKYLTEGHKIWNWRYNADTSEILHRTGNEVQVYSLGSGTGRSSRSQTYSLSTTREQNHEEGELCSVKIIADETVQLISHSPCAVAEEEADTFLDVLKKWKGKWMWENMVVSGASGCGLNMRCSSGFEWIREAIENNSLFAVSEGSYIKQLHPELCSAAVILECQQSGGLITLSFAEGSRFANAYRGELLGLMAIHLLLLSFNKVWPNLQGSVHIYSDCLGALDKVENLPPRRIPSKCRHSDILKNIMVNCSDLTLKRIFSHVKAHQDDRKGWEEMMERPAQMNCGCDHGAKDKIYSTVEEGVQRQREFPLEPLALFVGGEKVTTESGSLIRFEAHQKEAKAVMLERKVLDPSTFEEVAWRHVHRTLHDLPIMFRIFACKQVFDIAAVNYFVNKRDKSVCKTCPSCTVADETTGHILFCREEGRVNALHQFSTRVLHALNDAGTNRDLTFLIVSYIRGRGSIGMEEIVRHNILPPRIYGLRKVARPDRLEEIS